MAFNLAPSTAAAASSVAPCMSLRVAAAPASVSSVRRPASQAAGLRTQRQACRKQSVAPGRPAMKVACQALAEGATETGRRSGVPVFVMMPLDTVKKCGCELNRRKAVQASLAALKSAGVEGVMVDVWWGVVEAEGPRKYNFAGYMELVEMARKAGLKVQAVMSFHQCGGNVGDSVNIPLPRWVVEEMERDNDLCYTDQWGNRNFEYVSLGCDAMPVLKGRTPVECYTDFMRAFRDHFADYLGNTIVVRPSLPSPPCPALPATFNNCMFAGNPSRHGPGRRAALPVLPGEQRHLEVPRHRRLPMQRQVHAQQPEGGSGGGRQAEMGRRSPDRRRRLQQLARGHALLQARKRRVEHGVRRLLPVVVLADAPGPRRPRPVRRDVRVRRRRRPRRRGLREGGRHPLALRHPVARGGADGGVLQHAAPRRVPPGRARAGAARRRAQLHLRGDARRRAAAGRAVPARGPGAAGGRGRARRGRRAGGGERAAAVRRRGARPGRGHGRRARRRGPDGRVHVPANGPRPLPPGQLAPVRGVRAPHVRRRVLPGRGGARGARRRAGHGLAGARGGRGAAELTRTPTSDTGTSVRSVHSLVFGFLPFGRENARRSRTFSRSPMQCSRVEEGVTKPGGRERRGGHKLLSRFRLRSPEFVWEYIHLMQELQNCCVSCTR